MNGERGWLRAKKNGGERFSVEEEEQETGVGLSGNRGDIMHQLLGVGVLVMVGLGVG